MKQHTSKKMQLGVVKIAKLNAAANATPAQPNQLLSNSSCGHICPTVCSLNCTTL